MFGKEQHQYLQGIMDKWALAEWAESPFQDELEEEVDMDAAYEVFFLQADWQSLHGSK